MNTTTTTETTNSTAVAAAPAVEVKKWEAGAGLGPRMAKMFNDAIQAASWASRTQRELRGVKGRDEHEMDYVAIGASVQNSEYLPGMAAIQARHGHVVTPENYRTIVGELGSLAAQMKANPVVVDHREEPAVADAREVETQKQREEQEAAAAVNAQATSKALDELRAKYPWAQQDGSEHARLAANLKRLLSDAFPGVTFSCRSETASMMTAVRVSWTLGPTEKQAEEFTGYAAQGHFDGMDDSYNYSHSDKGDAWRQWFGAAKYVTVDRSAGDAFSIVESAMQASGACDQENGHWSAHDVTHRMFAMTSFPAGAVVTGVERIDGINAGSLEEFYRITYTVSAAAATPTPSACATTQDPSGIRVQENEEKDGVEVYFPGKPAQSVIEDLKRHGFRWALRSRCWYARRRESTMAYAYGLIGQAEKAAKRMNDIGHAAGARAMSEYCCGT